MIYDAVGTFTQGATIAEKWFYAILEYIILIIDIAGAIIIVAGIVIGLKELFQGNKNERIALAQSTGLGLEFIMCGEIIRTITTRTKEELIILGIVVIIRAALAVLSHWEVKKEKEAKEAEKDSN